MSALPTQEIVPMPSEYEAPQLEVLGQLSDLATGLGDDGQLTMVFSAP